jgi:two-component system, NarL family, response regulator NreC
MSNIRVFLADDHAVLLDGLKVLIDTQSDMEVVGQAGGGREAVRRMKNCEPDVVVIDVSMPDLGGAEATEQILKERPQIRVIALTRHSDQGYLRRLLSVGATGYILKKTAADELINAIRVVAAGSIYIDPSLVGTLVDRYVGRADSAQADHPTNELTGREEEVLRLIAWGLSNKEIAAKLGVSVKTIEFHKSRSTEKLRLRSRTDILRYALAQGWLQEEQAPE